MDLLDCRLSAYLVMGENRRSTRVGDWRMIQEIREAEGAIFIAGIQPRGRAYRKV